MKVADGRKKGLIDEKRRRIEVGDTITFRKYGALGIKIKLLSKD